MSSEISFLRAARLAAAEGLLRFQQRSVLAHGPRGDDLYIVEFPKSGITWLRFLVANTNLLLSGDTRTATFFNLNDLVPDIHANRWIGPPLLSVPGFRCIKSHATYNRFYSKAVYLVRDPRHVMPSYYSFLTQLGWYDGTLDRMIEHPQFGIDSWRRHVEGWLNNPRPAHAFIHVRYEDLLADTGAVLARLYRLFGYELDGDVIAAAVERSSLERMRKDEAQFSAGHPAHANLKFVRKDGAGGSRFALSPDNLHRIEEVAGPLMRLLGYALNG